MNESKTDAEKKAETDKEALELVEEQQSESTDSESELDQAKKALEKAQSDYLYLRADFDNFRKKTIEERSQWRKYGAEQTLKEVINIVDNFDLALMTEITSENLKSFADGVKMIRNELGQSLERSGVTEIPAEGKAFDPAMHEALGAEESSDIEDGHVLRVFKRAYKLHDRIIRPAQVIVAKAPTKKDN